MKQMEEIKQVSQLYKVLSDPTRLRILLLLKEGEHNVTAISEQLGNGTVRRFSSTKIIKR